MFKQKERLFFHSTFHSTVRTIEHWKGLNKSIIHITKEKTMLAEDLAQLRKRRRLAMEPDSEVSSCYSQKISTKANLKLRWTERISSSHLPSANFIYEVTFPELEALGFEAVPRSIYYSEDCDDYMECYTVKAVLPFYSNVIYPGDLLLRVNGQSLLRKSVNGEFIDPQKSNTCFENIALAGQPSTGFTSSSAFTSSALNTSSSSPTASAAITLRFMRNGSSSLNFSPSPAELNLFQVDKHIAAKYQVVKTVSGNENTVHWSVRLTFIDQQVNFNEL